MKKKLINISILILLAFVTISCFSNHSEQVRFNEYTLNEFIKRSTQDTLTLHFTLTNPSTYGIGEIKQTLGNISEEAFDEQANNLSDSYLELKSFNKSHLTKTQQRDYEIYEDYLEVEIKQSKNQTFDFLFAPDGLIHILSTNFLEYRLNHEEDIENYLFLLSDMERYLNSAMQFTNQQAKSGIFLSDFILDETIDNCNSFISKGEDHPLLNSFKQKISKLHLDNDKASFYIKENRRIMNEVVFPSIDSVATHLNELKGSSHYQRVGMARVPGGQAAYALLVQKNTGLKDSPQQIFNDLNERMIQSLATTANLLNESPQKTPTIDTQQINQNPTLLLNELRFNSKDKFPSIPEVRFNVSLMDESMASERVLAYFMPPPIDDPLDNVIKVNGSALNDDPLQYYSTLAHEGYPGHLYQYAYFMNRYTTPLRTSLNYLGYVEGWAKFVESEMLNYLNFENDTARKVAQLNANYGYYLQSACDLGVNDQGWTMDDLSAYLYNFGINDKKTIQQIYESVIAHPASILPYGVGSMKMNEYQQKAKLILSDKYDAKEFYQVILDCGPAPFHILEEDINDYLIKK